MNSLIASLIEFFTNETDLAVANRLTMAISDLTKEDFYPHDFKQIQIWWHSHENECTNWPISELKNALDKFTTSQFSEAANSFHKVLKLDPTADMSRAFAVGCDLELGETNKAAELIKAFKEPTARWAQWAGAMNELQTGSISNGTIRMADLARQNPVMLYLPHEGDYAWRKIDWQLYYKSISTGKPSP
jgi:hypothetical protein